MKMPTINKLFKNYQKKLFFFILMTALSLVRIESVWANNLIMKNFTVTSADQANNRISFSFDVNWENSWRNATNFDAVWVFLKYSTDGGVTWNHASMGAPGTNPSGFSAPANFEIVVPQDKKGFFLQRTDLSSGNVQSRGVRFVWDYGQDGLSDSVAMAANTINQVFGIEVVYIPQGAFYAGDGNSSSDYRFKQGSSDDEPWYIQNESAVTTTNGAADGYYYQSSGASGESNTGEIFLIPSSFPKGYQAFYLMKYELTEGQWVAFFNTLSSSQKSHRDITSVVQGGKNSEGIVNRNTIAWDANNPQFAATTSRPYRAISYISWPDLSAYSDWAALRPITELEFEKAARGVDVTPVPDEYAWGKTSYDSALAGEILPNADEDGTEKIFDSASNINRNGLAWTSGDGRAGGPAEGQIGPLRVGIFAENSDTRATSGAGYYGNMELSGNLSEMVVSLGRNQGRQFLGSHGDGKLSSMSGYEGNATNLDWPGIDTADTARGIDGTIGSGYRGGDFQSSNPRAFQISSRVYASVDPDSTGHNERYDSALGIFQGGRLGRTAP